MLLPLKTRPYGQTEMLLLLLLLLLWALIYRHSAVNGILRTLYYACCNGRQESSCLKDIILHVSANWIVCALYQGVCFV